ncbi:BTAD domain-containing putative transcriptional regulator [Kribbella sp. GL6]|uniref:AfsR/SARP family transcriptional regulator n=1 Tax=Kribbella sp. GL6 TaxID=3419765 RepID=UPI003CFD1717
MGSGVRFKILGELQIAMEDREVAINGRRQQIVLARLLCQPNRPVSADELVDATWGEAPPSTAAKQIQTAVWRLRGLLDEDRIRRLPAGYLLRADTEELDAMRFDQLVSEVATTDEPAAVSGVLREALGLWRGPALSGVESAAVQVAATKLDERRRETQYRCIDADLCLGRDARLASELAALIAEDPLNERFRGQYMQVLYRAGRIGDALDAYQDIRTTLLDELGVEPGPMLADLHRQILNREPGLDGTRERIAVPPPSVPRQLPPSVPHFAGRDRELARLTEAALTHDGTVRVVVLSGIGGVGKTALAVHWAHTLVDAYPDGQLFLNLCGYDASPALTSYDALKQLLRSVGVATDRVPATESEASALFRTMVSGRRMLIILDNASSADQVLSLIPGAPDCVVAVTSRHRLTGLMSDLGARRIELEPLPADDAVRLLASILGGQRADPEATAELAAACGYLPLALRLAGANCADQPYLSIRDQVLQLREGDRLDALEVEGSAAASVRTVFAQSYARLPAGPRRLFRLLGLLDGGDVPSWLTAPLLGNAAAEADRALRTLVDAQLLTVVGRDIDGRPRHRLHELLHLYARERAYAEETAADRDAAVRRALAAWLTVADAADHRTHIRVVPRIGGRAQRCQLPQATVDRLVADPLAWFEAERDGLVAAVRTAAEHGADEAAWELADTMVDYGELFALDLLESTTRYSLERCRRAGNRLGEAVMLRNLAICARSRSVFEPADGIGHAAAAAELFEQIGHAAGAADAHHLRGELLGVHDDPAAALASQALSLSLACAGEYPMGVVNACNEIGVTLRRTGRLDEAAWWAEAALPIARELGMLRQQIHLIGELGYLWMEQGRYDEAVPAVEEALGLIRGIGSPGEEAFLQLVLAEIRLRRGELGEAVEVFARCLRFAQLDRWPYGQAVALRGLGDAEAARGNLVRATTLLKSAGQIADEIQIPLLQGRIWHRLGNAQLRDGDAAAARESWTAARRHLALAGNAADLAAVDEALSCLRAG